MILKILPTRFVTPEELDSLIAYLKDKRARLVRSTADPLSGKNSLRFFLSLLLKHYTHANMYVERGIGGCY